MTLSIDIKGVGVHYGRTVAVENVSFKLEGNKIYGLLGRNGSGKTSLLSVLASFRQPTTGEVLIDGKITFENAEIMSQVCFIQEHGHMSDGYSVKDAIKLAASCWPNWDEQYANYLLDLYQLSQKKRISSLSRGMKSALGVTIGLASRAPITIFDEAYLGMDAPTRYAFYEEVLRDYMEHPRTFILSTHLIEEVGNLFEEVLILDNGRLLLQEESELLRQRGVTITGPAERVDEYVIGLQVLGEQTLGRTKSVTVYGELSQERVNRARTDGLELGPVALQDLFVHLTKKGGEGI
ncbi:ABC transporter ATP-binding protein [Paenibacillus paeoniae]|uniref:ABC transporter ATP-binding protein n=1 Tax=Paenibacillus paeoniae TaxID=2292705 RepID=A0A371P693_9BACL|nr:ABC transporter ATP-binding protein [Paenibacillus paeoniae]REK71439.1 ABC transporter ATP-binding protein [Paenibacillus paeoniae]